jgi:uncharacterized membrane protein
MFYGLTSLGVIHTAISLVAIVAGAIALVRDRKISMRTVAGKVYVAGMALTCVTGFGFFFLGSGLSKAQNLGIVTVVVLALAAVAERTRAFGKASPYVATVGYSATFLFQMIPGITQFTTRLPLDAPLFASDDVPPLQAINGILFLLFLIGATLQVIRIRRAR